MSDLPLDFVGLGRAVQDFEALGRHDTRSTVLRQYRGEILMLLAGLRIAEVIGQNVVPGDDAEDCDLCAGKLKPGSFYVDGRVQHRGGQWGNMCVTCFLQQGEGIGWGVGQLYAFNGRDWQCIGGGNPSPSNEGEED